ncbi:hypothetical protein NDU88_001291 [Pleurodeles waltl]|uniref:Uncharacterized protein n=1 Tax=Pleurodeles waltl TaxID=8319 RepID=A0AAV7LAV0_PLEWA|nr:hypothetical protein NDU88_001291 [Pleurodeles waltl]
MARRSPATRGGALRSKSGVEWSWRPCCWRRGFERQEQMLILGLGGSRRPQEANGEDSPRHPDRALPRDDTPGKEYFRSFSGGDYVRGILVGHDTEAQTRSVVVKRGKVFRPDT